MPDQDEEDVSPVAAPPEAVTPVAAPSVPSPQPTPPAPTPQEHYAMFGPSGTLPAQLPPNLPYDRPVQLPGGAWATRQSPQRTAAMQAAQEANIERQMIQSAQANKSLKAVEAAVQFIGLRRYQNDINAGIPIEKAIARAAPLMFWSHPQAIGPTMKAFQPVPPAFTPRAETLGGVQGIRHGLHGESFTPVKPPFTPSATTVDGTRLIETSPGRFTQPRPSAAEKEDPQKKEALSVLYKEKSALEKGLPVPPTDPKALEGYNKMFGDRIARLAKINKRITELNPYLSDQPPAKPTAAAPAAVAPAAAPAPSGKPAGGAQKVLELPPKRESLVKGQLYMTKAGVALWDGKQFRVVSK
jgi:hypothetical protein